MNNLKKLNTLKVHLQKGNQMPTTNTFSESKIMLRSTNLLEEHAREMHRWLLLTVAIFATAFSLVSLVLNDHQQAFVSALSVPGAGIAYLLARAGYLYISKIFNGLQIIAMIAIVSLLTGPETLTFMYFFPITISAIIAFQGKEKYTGYALVSIIFVVLIVLTTIPIPADNIHLNPEHLKIDRFANVIGVTICCIIILIFMIRAMDNVQRQLLESSNIVNDKNKELITALYSRDKLMSVIAHDLRSPMAAVSMTVDVCSKPNIDEETKSELLQLLKTKATQVMSMTDQLLDWSRSQTGNLQCNQETIPVNHFLNYVKEWGQLIAETKNITFDFQFNFNESDSILCDKNMIETAFRNLISNAVKFSENGSQIIIRSSVIENKRMFEFQDFGKGMTEDQLQKLNDGITFTSYGTNREKGNGFGLQLVQEFLRRHNSQLDIESKINEGSTFRFSL
jgi:signal transduction histidine kinase